MAEIRQGEEGNVRHRGATLPILCTDRIILARKQQAWHGHRWQYLGEAQTLKPLGPAGYESLHVVLQKARQTRRRIWPRPAAYLLAVRLNLRAVCAARSNPMADRVRSDASR